LTDDGTYLYYYDCENRLTDVNDQGDDPVASYTYDFAGRRVKKLVYGLTWSILGTGFNNYCAGDPGFLFAILFSIALSITGIFHSKEWLYGGIGIFIGALLAFFIKDYDYIVLGLATGVGLIIPAIIVQNTSCT